MYSGRSHNLTTPYSAVGQRAATILDMECLLNSNWSRGKRSVSTIFAFPQATSSQRAGSASFHRRSSAVVPLGSTQGFVGRFRHGYRRNLVVAARSGKGPLVFRFADLRHRGLPTRGF
jgi:hypothetical protein